MPLIDVNVTVTNNLTYRANLTSYITSVEPRRGGTGGGTQLTIAGSGFLSSGNKVTIAGTECEVQTESTTEIVCITGTHSPTEMAKVRVDVGAAGIAVQDNADFFYIDVWSSIYTWGGSNPPVKGDFAIILEGQTILLDETTPVLKVLLLKGGHMIFDEKDIELHAEYIIITNGGSLTVGTEDKPFQHEATIMLHGHVRTQELPIFGSKVLAVRNGTLDLHGKPVATTWTYLASTVFPGDVEMTLVQPVDWNVGNKIVIASTGHHHAQKENEVLKITGISTDSRTLTVTPRFKYTHISMNQTIDGIILETRAEVGLLSHNVKFRGSVHEEWVEKIEACDRNVDTNQFSTQTCFQGRFGEETGSDQYGAHIMLFAKEMNKNLIKGRISYVEVTHAGQAFRLGRYPIHFHMSGDIRGSYVRGCSIYNTFNRAVTIHGVHGFLVEHNVAYNVMGHAFFLEDGIETGNTLQYNLAVFVRPSSSLLNVDVTPAAYWITNPNNTVRHNAAAGGSHCGFWYNAPENPGGPSFTLRVRPRHVPLGEFYNNSAHTQGWYGIWIHPIYFPSEPAKFNTFFAWEVNKGAEAVEVGSVQFHNFLITDAKLVGLEFFTTFSVWGETGSYVNNSVVIGYSEVNDNNATGKCTPVGLQLPKTSGLTVDGVKFVNFDRPLCVSIKACKHCKADQGGFESRFKNLEWVNAPRKTAFKWEHECWFEDLDGTLTGSINHILLPQNNNLPPDHCEFEVEHSSWGAVPAAVCDETVTLHRMAWNNPVPASLHYKKVFLTNRFGVSVIPYHKKRLTHASGWMATLVEKENYNMRFEDVEHITNISYTARFDSFVDGQYVYITHNFLQRPDAFSLIGHIWNGTKGIPDPTTSTHGDFTFNNNTKQLTYIVTGNGNQRLGNYFIELQVYRCYYKNCITPKPKPQEEDTVTALRRWSEAKSWKDAPANWGGNKGNGKFGLPENGDNVQILPGVWMVADVTLPWMTKLFIYGTLEFEDTRNFVIDATYIFIHGGRLVAGFSEEEPFTHKLHFILRGNHFTPDMPLPNGPNMGSKVLGVFGELDLHGVTRDVTWTQLGATVQAGDNTIQLVEETDWGEGDEIMVTTTSYETWETETFLITEKMDKFNFRLNSSFRFRHIGNTHKLSDNSSEYTLSAEVGLLTRNIIIEGAGYKNLFNESFGARVIVGTFFQDGEEFNGLARISNVQFKHSGQEGWTDSYDPRYSLAFLNVGEITDEAPSYVRGCSFHNGFSTAIGVYGTHGLEVSDNVIHHVVGPGIVTWGEDTKLIHNLVSLIIFPGEYQDRYEPENLLWNGGIEVDNARRPVLINNTVAGSERVGFKIRGLSCDHPKDVNWYGNTVHATLHGVHLFAGARSGCALVSGFYIWNSFDYGIYAQIPSPLVVADSWLVDNKGGVLALIIGPGATSHRIVEKFVEIRDTTFVGTSPSFECFANSPRAGVFTAKHRRPKGPGGGVVGVYFSAFMSETNGAPFKPLHSVRSYPALRGVSKLTGVTFAEYGEACGRRNVIIMTNPASGDASHPIHLQSIHLLNVLKKCYLVIHRPSLGLVNPSDCVDMDCDGMKKAIILDLDGSFLGDVGTVIPQSEFEWDGDPRRGLGDYRIPRTMLTRPDGSRISVDDIAPNKGIYRGDSDCQWVSDWQAYECHNLDHMMMIVESMDDDTETRRVSPVSLYSDSYIDLINGPQDHGWCHGYTCQERISTFYTIVTTGRYYDVHFTGTTPQKLRYHLLNADEHQSLVVSTYYSNPQRLDVYANGIYILPTNGDMENGIFTWKAPEGSETNSDYYPNLNSKILGENYFDRDLDQLFILIRSSTVIEVLTTPVVMTTFGVPAVEVDDFFEKNIIENLANLLDIPKTKIRIVEIIREDSRRRKRRATGEVEVVVEIGNPPSTTSSPPEVSDVSNGTVATSTTVLPDGKEDPLSFAALLEIQTIIAYEMQTGHLEDSIGYHVTHLSMTDPIDTPVDPTGGVRATNETAGSPNATGLRYDELQALKEAQERTLHSPREYRIPNQLLVVTEPGGAMKNYPFLIQPKIIVVDDQGNLVEQLGHASHPWLLEVSLRNNRLALSGNTTYTFSKGWVNFTDLVINTTGTGFILDFAVIYPNTTSLAASSVEFDVEDQQLSLGVVDQPSVVNEGDPFDVVVEVKYEATGETAHISGSVAATVSLVMPSFYRGNLQGPVDVTVDPSTGLITFKNLSVSSSGVNYVLKVSVTITVSNNYIQQSLETDAFDVVDPADVVTSSGETVTLTLRFDADYDMVVAGQEEALKIYFLNHMASQYKNVTFSNIVISEGSILITFDISGDIRNAQAYIWEDVSEGEMVLNFSGHILVADQSYLLVNGELYVGEEDLSVVALILNITLLVLRIASFPFWAIVSFVTLALIMAIIIALGIYKVVFHRGSKVGSLTIEPHSPYVRPKQDPVVKLISKDRQTSDTSEDLSKDDGMQQSSPFAHTEPLQLQVPPSEPSSPPAAEKEIVQDEKNVTKFIRVKTADGTFKKLGTVKVNMAWKVWRIREELKRTDVCEKQFMLMDEQLRDLAPKKENSWVTSEVYPGESILIRWVESDESKQSTCICGLAGQLKCSFCQEQSYCSAKCQAAHWTEHSKICNIYNQISQKQTSSCPNISSTSIRVE
ncbi:Fibrocystin-L [Holothuria leucospilota]|uniref:Fibrocystin-L n=1 Tax=Holothuria leucospilota TaxID=206669 RepID=A0A9Q0YT00_HOLLE|nr:Fibrocystin-L [Holothuria leucospilota]